MRRAWLALAAALACVLALAGVAHAAPDVTARISADEVEAGQEFTIQLDALTEDGSMPSDPVLDVPAGIIAYSPRLGTRTEMRMGGGVTLVQKGLSATWTLVAEEPGTYTIPAPSVMLSGMRVPAASGFTVRVTPGSRAQIPPPLGGAGDDKLDGESLKMPKAPDPKLFVRAVPDKTTLFVGEQVTLSYYLYYRVDFKMTDRHEPALADFLRVGLAKNPGADPPVRTRAGNLPFEVRLLDRMAAFPLRAGTLTTGVLSAKFTGGRIGSGELRTSNDLTLEVREPPVAGRPLGYRIGDVGDYRLQAEVEPRDIQQGGAVSVRVRLDGTGALPNSLRIPQRTGIEWLDPEKRSQTTVVGGRVGGFRTFGYVVHVNEAGDVDLGAIELPFWKPDGKGGGRYEVARAELGVVRVKASAAAPEPSDKRDGGAEEPAGDTFAGIGEPRTALGSYVPRSEVALEPPVVFGLVLAPPLGVLLGLGLRRGILALLRRRAARRHDPGALAERALHDMRRAGDPKAMAGAVERAVHQAVEAATRLKSRAVLLAELRGELERRGLPGELAEETRAVLAACEEVRYVPTGEAGTRDLAARAERLVKRLLKAAAGREGGRAPGAVGAGVALVCALVTSAGAARADAPEEFQKGVEALAAGRFEDAVDRYERLADRGFVHPDASYNRGLAYVARIRAGADKPGDLGRAAAAFEETLLMRADDEAADRALELVHAEVARRRGRRGKDSVTVRPTLDRVLAGLAPERTWGIAAGVAGALLGLGILLRRRPKGPVHVAGVLLIPTAFVAAASLGALYFGARNLRLHVRQGVVVMREAHMSDANGTALGGEAVPEAAHVELGEQADKLVHARWGSTDGWLPVSAVRVLRQR
ncbi:MAG: BatD family protein [Polyangiaceae bacterium]|nr:BatD family protein [Polyangiaceae bacterium]